MIETERLLLRTWREEDHGAYAAMMADPEVGYWLGGPFDAAGSRARIERFMSYFAELGFGRYAIERRSDGMLLGHCGLAPVGEGVPFAPAVEIGWGLHRDAWGQGYATEAARAAVAEGFERHGLDRIYAYTSTENARSQSVMAKLGMLRRADLDFDHPVLAEGHPLRRHIVFVVDA